MWLYGSWFYQGYFTQMSPDSTYPCLSTYSAGNKTHLHTWCFLKTISVPCLATLVKHNGQQLVPHCESTLFNLSWVCLWKHFQHVISTAFPEWVDQWNETKTDWKASSSPHSVQAASHCRFGPCQNNNWYYRVFIIITLSRRIQNLSLWSKCLNLAIMCPHMCI